MIHEAALWVDYSLGRHIGKSVLANMRAMHYLLA